ncbi:hypothetical protein IE077_002320 [Cardiosporidium cionae]|uniref:Uncharacterized protein n=1 Tax=Cardiosporidium cionae TaxID=476202 RepID=A0ABQ7JB26_9APIC|nr:hypothetical protein IE077_002320 [Cardiosporidium cionae]|eukprot:KAF8821210.1 hypothetical protein IE077_002320 [Cardiosporidium cionae]
MVSVKLFAIVCVLFVCGNSFITHGIAQEVPDTVADAKQLFQSLDNIPQYENFLPPAKEFMESLGGVQENSELLSEIWKRMSQDSTDPLSLPLRTFDQFESQFFAFLSAQFPAIFAQLSNQQCTLIGVNPRCFLIDYAGAIGATWNTTSADIQKMTQFVDTLLQPLGLTRSFAKLVCFSAPKTFPILTFQNGIETHAQTQAILTAQVPPNSPENNGIRYYKPGFMLGKNFPRYQILIHDFLQTQILHTETFIKVQIMSLR